MRGIWKRMRKNWSNVEWIDGGFEVVVGVVWIYHILFLLRSGY